MINFDSTRGELLKYITEVVYLITIKDYIVNKFELYIIYIIYIILCSITMEFRNLNVINMLELYLYWLFYYMF